MVLETDPWLTETRCVAAQAALHSAQVLPHMYDLSCLPVTSAEAGVLAAWQGARGQTGPGHVAGPRTMCRFRQQQIFD